MVQGGATPLRVAEEKEGRLCDWLVQFLLEGFLLDSEMIVTRIDVHFVDT